MIYIQTDLEDTNWLRYILDEFIRIQRANFDIIIIGSIKSENYTNIIYYNTKLTEEPSVYCSNRIQPTGVIEYLKQDLFVLQGSRTKDFSINYDLFWNAFVFLSRYEEYLSEKEGKFINSYSFNHIRKNKNSFDIPIVNILFNELESLIKQFFPSLTFSKQQKVKIDFTHDIDYIEKTIQLRIKQTIFNSFKTIKSLNKPRVFFKNFIKTIQFAFANSSYWCFNYWKTIEKGYGVRSTFYVYVKYGKKNFKSWLLDPSYDIANNLKLIETLKSLKSEGFEIGLHGSYESANSYCILKKEKEILGSVLGFEITKTRQHWLNYNEGITPYNHEKLFKYDSTLGWNDRIGFRSGIASKYRPYDHINQKAFNYEVIPQVIMDSNLYDYGANSDIEDKVNKLMSRVKKIVKLPFISISWHQRVCASDYKWNKFYEKLLKVI